MIIYKPKNSNRIPYKPLKYLNLLVLTIIIGIFVAFNLKVSDDAVDPAPMVEASVPENVNVSGEWVGIITEDYGSETRYEYTIILEQRGAHITGLGIQDATNSPYDIYAESSLIGDIEGDTLYFYEASTDILENLTLDRWCRIEVTLDYEVVDGLETLVGTWDSVEDNRPGCTTIDGRVVLTRQP